MSECAKCGVTVIVLVVIADVCRAQQKTEPALPVVQPPPILE
jgi:hypothetical protein